MQPILIYVQLKILKVNFMNQQVKQSKLQSYGYRLLTGEERGASLFGGDAFNFQGSLGNNGEGVKSRAKLVGEGIVDHAVTLHQALPFKFWGHNPQIEMSFAGAGVRVSLDGGMAGVLVGNVFNLKKGSFQRRLELCPHPARPRYQALGPKRRHFSLQQYRRTKGP